MKILFGKRGEIMEKTYIDFMDEITSTELYEKLVEHGLFSEKLPPLFSAHDFLEYCKSIRTAPFPNTARDYITFDSMRNINIPRTIGIPAPMTHEKLCKVLADSWDDIKEHFKVCTEKQLYKVSRLHIRRLHESDALFEMNYKNWRTDGSPEPDLLIGKRYMVCADISKCYPSIYTHAIPWALVGKETAKLNKGNKTLWYNMIDSSAQRSRNQETHGILIGPHTSNILSEIILCAIDKKLVDAGWQYIRNIDDYCCYVESRERAEEFLVDLNRELKQFDLLLNHKKTNIIELPIGSVEHWKNLLNDKAAFLGNKRGYVDYKEVRSFCDYFISLMSHNEENSAIIFYGLRILSGYKLSKNAQQYLIKIIVSLSLIFPYIVPLLNKYVFSVYDCSKAQIQSYANIIFDTYLKKENFEACAFALHLMIDYSLVAINFNIDDIIKSDDCILLVTALVYCRKINDNESLKKLKDYARSIVLTNFDKNWLFLYECLSVGYFKEEWRDMKSNNISFLHSKYR